MLGAGESVNIWTAGTGEPVRMVWRSRRYRVNDSPTPLVGPCDWWRPFDQHEIGYGRSPLQITGWRFQARAEDGDTRVFDVEHDPGDDRWRVVRVFD